jgi:hypothetical protein
MKRWISGVQLDDLRSLPLDRHCKGDKRHRLDVLN